MFSKSLVKLVAMICFMVSFTVSGRAESPELMNLMRTMPKDSMVYVVINFSELTNLLPIWETDENGKRRMIEEYRKDLMAGTETSSPFSQFMAQKMESGDIRWMVLGIKDISASEDNYKQAGVDIRLFGNFTHEEVKHASAQENIEFPEMGNIIKLEEGFHVTMFDDYYAGLSTNPSMLTLNHDEPLSKAAQHLGQILPVSPPMTFAISFQEFLNSSGPTPGTPPNLKEIRAASLTFNNNNNGNYSLDALIQYNSAEALETGFGLVNNYRQMAPLFLQQARQQATMQPNLTPVEKAQQKKTFDSMEKLLREITIIKNAPNLVVRVPVDLSILEDPEFLRGFMVGFVDARDRSQGNACYENQVKLDGAVQQYILEENKPNLAACTELHTNDVSDPKFQGVIFGPNAYIREVVKCPAGGKYSILSSDGRNGEAVRCSLPQHPFPTYQ